MIVSTPQALNHSAQHSTEISHKLTLMRNALRETGAAGIRLRGTDWFSWATAGACHSVLLAAETGVADLLVTADSAWLLTNEIEAQRFRDEELPGRGEAGGYEIFSFPWANPAVQEAFVQEATGGGTVLSDKPAGSSEPRTAAEASLPSALVHQKRVLLPSELERYRQVGRLATEAMTEVLLNAQPDWTENQLAGAGAAALWARGLHPALTLAAGERRSPLYRHPVPTHEAIGRIAMLVFCARGYGLYANLTRFVCFGSLTSQEADRHEQVRAVEAEALNVCRPGIALSQVYGTIAQSYAQHEQMHAIREHHQGGTTGYLARETIATPHAHDVLTANMVLALNPSLPGAKIEDTFVIRETGLENLTLDPNWQSVEVEGRLRPLPMER